ERTAHELRGEAESARRPQRVAAGEPDVGRGIARFEARRELVANPGLACARGAGDEHGDRARFAFALREVAVEQGELDVAPNAGRGLAEERARPLLLAKALEREAFVATVDLEARVEEAGRDLVEANDASAFTGGWPPPFCPSPLDVAAEETRRALDDLSQHAA